MTSWTLLALVLGTPPPPAPSDRVEYYEVRGSTDQQLRAEMSRLGPRGDDGVRYDGYTHWYVRWRFEYEAKAQCVLTAARTSVEITTTLPRWIADDDAPESLLRRWKAFVQALERHEEGHARFGREAARAIRKRLLEHPPAPDCASLDAALNAAAEETLEAVRERERDYDRRTRNGATEGAVFP